MRDRNDQIRVVIVAADRNALSGLLNLLTPFPQIAIVGSTIDTDTALAEIRRREPDIVLAELNTSPLPGIKLTKRISIDFPTVATIIVANQAGLGFFKEAMRVGASDFLVRPITGDELWKSIRQVCEVQQERALQMATRVREPEVTIDGKLVVVCGAKGGVGKTLLSTNLAALLGSLYPGKIALIDLNLQFGNVDLFLSLPTDRTIKSLGAVMQELQKQSVESVLHSTPYGLKVLLAPTSPEDADNFDGNDIASLLVFFKRTYPLTIVDTASYVNDVLLVALQEADLILAVTLPELPALRETGKLLRVLNQLRYEPDKVKVIVNQMGDGAIDVERIRRTLGQPVFATVPASTEVVQNMVNQGNLIIRDSRASITQAIRSLARQVVPLIVTDALGQPRRAAPAQPKKGARRPLKRPRFRR